MEKLLAALRAVDPPLTPVEVAEALWLARFLDPAQSQSARRPGAEPATPEPIGPSAPVADTLRPDPPDPPPAVPPRSVVAELYLPPVRSGTATVRALPARSPAVPALSDTLRLLRALRPLRRKVPSKRQESLHEADTARVSAEARAWLPMYRPTLARWMDLAVVVDTADSMAVWRPTVAELERMLERLGAFRDVRRWQVDGDLSASDALVLRPGTGGAAARSPRELPDPTRRRLIMVVSDCVGRAWRDGTMQRWLELCGRYSPVAIVQPLPQRLWDRCAVEPVHARLTADLPGAPNATLRVVPRHRESDVACRGVPIPLLEPDARWFGPWASLVAGSAPSGIWAKALFTGNPAGPPPEPSEVDDDPVGMVRTFRASASARAFRLANYLAAAPLSLPVMRLVQAQLMPDSHPRDLAEVYLSDLMYQTTPSGADVPPDEVRFDYRPGVRELLLTTLDRGTQLLILSRVSEFVRARLGATLDFAALVAGAGAAAELTEADRPFATVAHSVLRNLGGRYRAIADLLARNLGTTTDLAPPRPAPVRPPSTTTTPGDVVTEQASPPPSGTSEQPKIWGSVPPRNPNFTGRAALLERLRDQLTENPTALLPHTLHGLGGVGKTQLAVEYVWLYGDRYDLVWWIAAEQPALIRSSLVELADRLGLPRGEDVDRTLTAVHDALRTHSPHRRWLLVFDNANQPADLGRFMSTPGGHILITSRDRTWSDVAKTVEVDVFERLESVQLLQRRIPEITAPAADQLADHLGDLPLALEQAASWILATATPVADYLELLGERVGQLMQEDPPTTYPLPVAATWGLAFDQLRRQAPAAVQLLELSSFLGAEPVSIRMIRDGRYASLPSPLDTTVRDEIPLRRAVRDISRYGLAKVDSLRNTIQVHRLVQAVLRDSLSPEQRASYRQSVHELLAAANPGDPTNDPPSWSRHADITPHVRAAGLVDAESADSHKVVLDQVRYLWVIGDFESSRDLAQLAYDDWSARLGSDYEQTLVVGRYLANALRSAGQTDEAARLNRDILDRCRVTLGDDHEHTLTTANSMGADLRWQGRWREARESDEDTLRRHVAVFGEDDTNTLNCANNLAVDLRLLTDFDAARRLDEDTIRRRRQVLGDDHHQTLRGINSLSRDYYGLGDFARALELQEQSLPQHQAVLGPDHSDVIQATRVHVQTLRSMGRREQACDVAEKMVAESTRALGSEHPVTLHAMTALANSLAEADRLSEACAIGEAAHTGYRRVLGDQNPFTLAAATNLAVMLRRSGDLLAARSLDEAALAGFTASLGADHTYTLCCAVNTAVDLALALEYAAAVELGTDTLQRLRTWGGAEHPDYLVCLSNYSIDVQASGDVARARLLHQEALAGQRKVLGPTHPETLLAEAGRHNALWVEPSTP